MAKRKSAGLLHFQDHARELRVLLAHPGGPYFRKKDAGHWSIPKGEYGADEDPLTAARREFEEETGHEPQAPFIPLGEITQKGGKVVIAWAFRGAWDPEAFRCNTFPLEWPPRSGRRIDCPEVDRAELMSIPEAREAIKPTQVPFLERLQEALGKGSGI